MEGAIEWRAVVPLVRGHGGAALASCGELVENLWSALLGEAQNWFGSAN
jgi:hypothetical protein